MLHPDLRKLGPAAVAREIREKGYFSFERALSLEAIEAAERELGLWNFPINSNDVHAVTSRHSNFFCHVLAKSPTLYRLETHPFVLDLAEAYIGPKFRLTAQRVYSVFRGTDMPWHSDNKALGEKRNNYDGLIFIFYFKDVIDGEFQIIRNSHTWSPEYTFSNFDEAVISTKYKDDIISFKMPAGSVVIYNERAVHRAKPITRSDWYRTSLFFQVDNIVDNAEKILLNPEFITDATPRIQQYLGFGKPATYPTAPEHTSLATFRPGQLMGLQGQTLVALGRFYLESMKDLIPRAWRHTIKAALGKKVDWNTR